jgi:hypothetical protein
MWARSKRLPLVWFDNQALPASGEFDRRVEWLRTLPFIGMHVMCLGAIWAGVSTTAVVVAIALYVVRMVAITGFYHRYFSHGLFALRARCSSCSQYWELWPSSEGRSGGLPTTGITMHTPMRSTTVTRHRGMGSGGVTSGGS